MERVFFPFTAMTFGLAKSWVQAGVIDKRNGGVPIGLLLAVTTILVMLGPTLVIDVLFVVPGLIIGELVNTRNPH